MVVATCDGEFGVVARAVWSLKSRVAAGEDWTSIAEALTRKALDKGSQLRELVKRLNWTVGGECGRIAELVNSVDMCLVGHHYGLARE